MKLGSVSNQSGEVGIGSQAVEGTLCGMSVSVHGTPEQAQLLARRFEKQQEGRVDSSSVQIWGGGKAVLANLLSLMGCEGSQAADVGVMCARFKEWNNELPQSRSDNGTYADLAASVEGEQAKGVLENLVFWSAMIRQDAQSDDSREIGVPDDFAEVSTLFEDLAVRAGVNVLEFSQMVQRRLKCLE